MQQKRIALLVVAAHTVLLAGYTLPRTLVPEQVRVIGQLYTRPLFHQQWTLFAPDPPLCSCALQARWGEHPWSGIEHGPDTYLRRRAGQALARHVQAGVHAGDIKPAPELLRAMRAMALYSEFEPGSGRALPEIEFRLVEHCVVDPSDPVMREERITLLDTP